MTSVIRKKRVGHKRRARAKAAHAVCIGRDGSHTKAHDLPSIEGWEALSYSEEVRERFKDLQELLELSDEQMAEKFGFSRAQYHMLLTMARVPAQLRQFAQGCDSVGVGMDAMLAKKHAGLPWKIQEYFSVKADMKHDWSVPKQQLLETLDRLKSLEGCSTPEDVSKKTGVSLHTCKTAFNADQGSLLVIALKLNKDPVLKLDVGWLFNGEQE